MKIVLKENMEFISNDGVSKFTLKKYDYYGNGVEWCAFTETQIYPLTEIDLSVYIPKIDGVWINEQNEYVER